MRMALILLLIAIPLSGIAAHGENMKASVNGINIDIIWENNPSAEALREMAREGDIRIETERYGGFEQVGALPRRIASSDERITAQPGDIVLYRGDSICLYFGQNTWSFTRLGRIISPEGAELARLLDVPSAVIILEYAEGI